MIYQGDCKEVLASISGISAVVTDPPYHLVSISERFGSPTARNTPSMNTPEGSVWARKAKGFMGSGTTLLACIKLGIPCIGIDNDEKACEIAVKRCSYEGSI